jgi:hypothetical protein
LKAAADNFVLIQMFHEGVKNHLPMSFRVDADVGEYGTDYPIS